MILSASGRVCATGGNSFGQLGINSKKSSSVPVRVTGLDGVCVKKVSCGSHSAAVTDRGDLYVWGTGLFGEYLVPSRMKTDSPVVDIAVGGSFGLAVDYNRLVYAWGSNSNGELG